MNALITYIIVTVVSLGIFYTGYAVFLRKEPIFGFNRFYLLSSLFISYLIPLLLFAPPVFFKAMAGLPANGILKLITLSPVVISASDVKLTIFPNFLVLIYFIGMIFFAARLLIRIINIYKIRRDGYKSGNENLILWSTSNIPPFSFLRTMYLPANLKETPHIHDIIRHEQIHIDGLHSIDIICTQVFQIVFWFNPFITLTERALREIHEFKADKVVISAGIDPVVYTRILFSQDKTALAVVLGNNFNYSLIKRRITMFYKKSTRYALLKAIVVLPLAACIVMMFSISCQHSADDSPAAIKQTEAIPAPPPPPPPPPPAEKSVTPDDVFTVVENMPQYPGGDKARMQYMMDNIKYPEKAKQEGISGTVYVTFLVEKNGSIGTVKILKGIGGGCDEEALRVVSTMPKWKPGYQNGQPVRVQFNMPVSFKLS